MQHVDAIQAFAAAALWTLERQDNHERGLTEEEPWTKAMADEAFDEVQEAFVALAEYLKLPAIGELLRTIAEEHYPDVDNGRIVSLQGRVCELELRVKEYVDQLDRTKLRAIKERDRLLGMALETESPFVSHFKFNNFPKALKEALSKMVPNIMDDPNDIPF